MSEGGRYFEDFVAGAVYRSRVGRTVTETDNTWFTLLTNNSNQIHFNREYASQTEFGQPLVNSTLTLAIVVGLTVADTSEHGFALGWDNVRLPQPLFAGETLYAETVVLEVRASASRPTLGIVRFRTRGITGKGVVVLEYERSVMVWKRAHAPDAWFPTVTPPD